MEPRSKARLRPWVIFLLLLLAVLILAGTLFFRAVRREYAMGEIAQICALERVSGREQYLEVPVRYVIMPNYLVTKQHTNFMLSGTIEPVAEAIRQSGADCVFVCLGAPKQELWMAKWGPETGAHLLCGLGGSLDVFAGGVERAPKFWSDHGLEWFYRLCREPKRIGRMMKLPLFLVHVRKEKRKK